MEICMNALEKNDLENSGLATCFAFSNDMCRAAVGGSLEDFVQYARNPTFGSLLNCRQWRAEPLQLVNTCTPTRGPMATQVVHVVGRDERRKSFLWTLQQERRPPLQGSWLIWQCLAKDKAIYLTV